MSKKKNYGFMSAWTKRKISPKQRLAISNAQHERLVHKNETKYKTSKEEKYQQRSLYHGLVKNLQMRENRVFNHDEKKRAWNRMISDMY